MYETWLAGRCTFAEALAMVVMFQFTPVVESGGGDDKSRPEGSILPWRDGR